jgi:hypothetical protein
MVFRDKGCKELVASTEDIDKPSGWRKLANWGEARWLVQKASVYRPPKTDPKRFKRPRGGVFSYKAVCGKWLVE